MLNEASRGWLVVPRLHASGGGVAKGLGGEKAAMRADLED